MNFAFVLLAVAAGLLGSNEIRSSAFAFPYTSYVNNRIHGKNNNINRFVSYSTRTSSAIHQNTNASLPPSKIAVTNNNIPSNPTTSSTTRTTRTRRHPRGFWADINNIRTEILAFWSSLSIPIPISEQSKPPIPNESLLNHFLRHDLRYGIASHGGREVVSHRLGGARVMPGKWKKAVLTRELRLLLDQQQQQKKKNDDDGLNVWELLSEEIPPVPPQEKIKRMMKKPRLIQSRLISNKPSSPSSIDVTRYNSNMTTIPTSNDGNITSILQIRNVTRWKHREGRRKWGYWDKQNVLDELHTFLVDYGKHHNQPSIWMPRMSELSAWGRKDLYSAIIRFYGRDKSIICDAAGLIPSNEWEYFQSLHDLILELLIYLKQRNNNHPQEQQEEERAKHEHEEELFFPPLSEIREHASPKLYSLIQRHGGRKLVARRFNMRLSLKQKSKQTTNTAARTTITTSSSPVMEDDFFDYSNYECLSWGSFSLEFALELLSYMRSRMLRIQQQTYSQQGYNPMSLISMPTKKELARTSDGIDFANKIEQYGGFENVARRLGLLWDE